MMLLQRELLGDYEPNDFIQNKEISEEQALDAHRKLLLSGFLEKTMSALGKAEAARRETIFNPTDQITSSPETFNTHNQKTPSYSRSNLNTPQVKYVQVKLADGRTIEVPENCYTSDEQINENPPFSSTHLPNAAQGRKSVNFSNAPCLNNIPRNNRGGEPHYARAREGGTSAGNEFNANANLHP